MKRVLFVLVTLMITLSFAYQGEAAIDPKTIVGIWMLDEGSGAIAADTSGNGLDGEVVQPAEWVAGQFNGALYFPEDGFVKIGPDPALNLVTWSLSLWYKGEPRTDKWQGVAGKPNTGERNYAILYLNATGAPRTEFTAGPAQWKAINGKTAINDNKWHHIVGTYDMKDLKLYVDGAEEAAVALTDTPSPQADQAFCIGRTGGHMCKGALDDVGLFSVGIGADDVKSIMATGLSGVTAAVSSLDKLSTTWGDLKSE